MPEWINPGLLSELGQKVGEKYERYFETHRLKEELHHRHPVPYRLFPQINLFRG